MNSVCERATWGHLIPQVIPPPLYWGSPALLGLVLDSRSSRSLIVWGISEDLFSNASLYKERGLFQVLLIFPVGGKLQGACARVELLTVDCEADTASISTQLSFSLF